MVIESHAWRERLGLRGGWTFVAEEVFIYNKYPMSWGNKGVLINRKFLCALFDPPREKEPLTTLHYNVFTTSMLLTERGIFGR